ncbi:MAG: dipeptidase PepE [Bacteroidota bacterium]
MRLLLISNSTNPGEPYLDYPKHEIKNFLGDSVKKVLFLPYAGVTVTWDDYTKKVADRFKELGYDVDPIYRHANPVEAVEKAEAIVVGGGNTFRLLQLIRDSGLIEPVRQKVFSGTPYIGWSAGSNLACPTIRTTNDMPVIQPDSFKAFNLIPFQINPHYLDAHPEGHAGETREQRLEEFLELNPEMCVAGLREGCMLRVEGKSLQHIGSKTMRIFKKGREPREVASGEDLNCLMVC